MPKDKQPLIPRQRPVSCRFCRSRKLRCSRESPCSNCVSRGMRCELETLVSPSPATQNASESELLARIRKLEELVDSQNLQQNASIKQQLECSDTAPKLARSWKLSPQIEHLDNDVAWLESIYNGQDLADKTPSNKVVFRTCPIQQILDAQPYINQNTYFSSTSFEPMRCIWLPLYHEAKILFEKFVQDTDHIHHVVHTPSLPIILDEVYDCLTQQSQVKSGYIILLLGIFASTTHSWMQDDSGRGLFSTHTEANSQSSLWIKATEDVLDISHRTTSVSIEGIQGIIIALFALLNMEGFSRRCKSFFNMALLLARELGLHVLDHPSNAKLANSPRTEMGRRVWWYLVSSDWQVPTKFKGVSEGVYQCHPRHMLVKKPMNLNDEDLVEGMTCIEQPFSQPTTMSYPLQRIRLSEISRRLVDRMPLTMAYTSGPTHDIIVDIDTELQSLINDTPPFFSMPVADLIAIYHLSPSRAANIAHQGYTFYSLVFAQRCSLHFPYFTRGFVDSAYASSRQICLQSAHQVIQNETRWVHSRGYVTRYKYLGLLAAVFMASIVLLMDLCHNKSSSQQEKKRSEIADAIRILDGARLESETAAKFLDSLMQVLSNHKLSLKRASQQPLGVGFDNEQLKSGRGIISSPIPTQPNIRPTLVPISTASTSIPENHEASSTNMAEDGVENVEDLSLYFNDLAQSFEQGVDFGTIDWINLFTELDPSTV